MFRLLCATIFIMLVLSPGLRPRLHAQNVTDVNMPALEWRPYFIETGSPEQGQGLAMDMMQHCFDQKKIKVHRIPTSMKRNPHMMKAGDIDLWVFSHRTGREEWLVYSQEALLYDGYGVFIPALSDFEFQQLEDLKGLRIGTLLGLKISAAFQKIAPRYNVVKFPTEKALLTRLLEGRIDVAVTGIGAFRQVAFEEGKAKSIKLSGDPIRVKNYYAVVSKTSKNIPDAQRFLKDLDQCLYQLKSSSKMEELYEKYIGNQFSR